MKICWDTLEKVRLNKNGMLYINDKGKHTTIYYELECPNCKDIFLGRKGTLCCSTQCKIMYRNERQNLWLDDEGNIIKRTCIRCGKPKLLKEYNSKVSSKIGVSNICRECESEHYYKDQEHHSKSRKDYYRKLAIFDTYASQLIGEEVRRSTDNNSLLEVRCHHCRKWFKPINGIVKPRIMAIQGKVKALYNFYCSDQCKTQCPDFNTMTRSNVGITNPDELSNELCACGCGQFISKRTARDRIGGRSKGFVKGHKL